MVIDFMGDYCTVYGCISQITPYVINSREKNGEGVCLSQSIETKGTGSAVEGTEE